jgi:hypothetical protein
MSSHDKAERHGSHHAEDTSQHSVSTVGLGPCSLMAILRTPVQCGPGGVAAQEDAAAAVFMAGMTQ